MTVTFFHPKHPPRRDKQQVADDLERILTEMAIELSGYQDPRAGGKS